MEVPINMLTLMRWEAMRRKSFFRVDWNDPEDLDVLSYLMYALPKGVPYDEFLRATARSDKLKADFQRRLEATIKAMALDSQFEWDDASPVAETRKPDTETQRLSDIVPALILAGMEADYALYRMTLAELNLFVLAYDRMRRDQAEDRRFWTYFQLLPHYERNALRDGPTSLFLFPWEEEERREIRDEDTRMLDAFLASGKKLYKKRKPSKR